jgi:hypothetical protein
MTETCRHGKTRFQECDSCAGGFDNASPLLTADLRLGRDAWKRAAEAAERERDDLHREVAFWKKEYEVLKAKQEFLQEEHANRLEKAESDTGK